MKRQIRRKVFETNSSSMHSLTVEKLGVTEYLHVDEVENKVIVNYGEFGRGAIPHRQGTLRAFEA